MGGRGASSGGGGVRGVISTGERDVNYSKAGASFSKLSPNLQDSINDNLKMSQNMKNDISNGRKNGMTDEWVTGRGKDKIKVITDVKNGKAVYTIKQGRKVLSKNVTKEQAANGVARFYLSLFNRR